MAATQHWSGQDLHNLVRVVPLQKPLDPATGDVIGVEVTEYGRPAGLSGDIYAYVTGSDGETRRIQGMITDTNKASFTMTNAAYVPGQVSVVIKLENGSGAVTIAARTGFVKSAG